MIQKAEQVNPPPPHVFSIFSLLLKIIFSYATENMFRLAYFKRKINKK